MFVAAVAVAMFLSVAFGLSRRGSSGFYHFLLDHPAAIKPARFVFTLVGTQKRFDARLLEARVWRLLAPD
jgi:hypothetical protein